MPYKILGHLYVANLIIAPTCTHHTKNSLFHWPNKDINTNANKDRHSSIFTDISKQFINSSHGYHFNSHQRGGDIVVFYKRCKTHEYNDKQVYFSTSIAKISSQVQRICHRFVLNNMLHVRLYTCIVVSSLQC